VNRELRLESIDTAFDLRLRDQDVGRNGRLPEIGPNAVSYVRDNGAFSSVSNIKEQFSYSQLEMRASGKTSFKEPIQVATRL